MSQGPKSVSVFFFFSFSVLLLMSVHICPVHVDMLADFNMYVTVIKDFHYYKLSHFLVKLHLHILNEQIVL